LDEDSYATGDNKWFPFARGRHQVSALLRSRHILPAAGDPITPRERRKPIDRARLIMPMIRQLCRR
jgi:uncharacterized protein (DUF58 family)